MPTNDDQDESTDIYFIAKMSDKALGEPLPGNSLWAIQGNTVDAFQWMGEYRFFLVFAESLQVAEALVKLSCLSLFADPGKADADLKRKYGEAVRFGIRMKILEVSCDRDLVCMDNQSQNE